MKVLSSEGLTKLITLIKNNFIKTTDVESVSELEIDSAPTSASANLVTSGGVYTALSGKLDKNTAITGATKCKITYDANGLVTAGTDITASDISDVTATASELNVLDGITATTTELNYTDGVTSNIQTQLDAKQDVITEQTSSVTSGTVTTVNDTRIIFSNSITAVTLSGLDDSSVHNREVYFTCGANNPLTVTGVTWAVATPYFVSGDTYWINFEKIGSSVVGVWTQV